MSKELATLSDEEMMEELAMANPEQETEIDRAKAEALFRRITSEPATARRPAAWRGLPALAGTAVAAIAIVVGGVWVTAGGGSEGTANPDGGINPGGSLGLCVEQYSLENLAKRAFAFDGTVEAIDGTLVTFRVNEWYRGGESETVTLDGGTLLAITPDSDVVLEPGGRYLVSGEETFAWGCGFTQAYDAGVAAEWAEVLK